MITIEKAAFDPRLLQLSANKVDKFSNMKNGIGEIHQNVRSSFFFFFGPSIILCNVRLKREKGREAGDSKIPSDIHTLSMEEALCSLFPKWNM